MINTVDIKIYNITLKDSPSWTLHLANTTNVHVYNINITAASTSHNTDGFDVDCSVNVLVENSYYSGGKSRFLNKLKENTWKSDLLGFLKSTTF